MAKQCEAKFHYMPMFALNNTVLMMGVRANKTMNNTQISKKFGERPELPTPISL
jgi:hypothetical protein